MSIIYEEFREGPIAHIAEFPDASPEECLKAVRRMNGAERSAAPAETFLTRIRNEDDFVDITVGGQACEYPRCYAVGL